MTAWGWKVWNNEPAISNGLHVGYSHGVIQKEQQHRSYHQVTTVSMGDDGKWCHWYVKASWNRNVLSVYTVKCVKCVHCQWGYLSYQVPHTHNSDMVSPPGEHCCLTCWSESASKLCFVWQTMTWFWLNWFCFTEQQNKLIYSMLDNHLPNISGNCNEQWMYHDHLHSQCVRLGWCQLQSSSRWDRPLTIAHRAPSSSGTTPSLRCSRRYFDQKPVNSHQKFSTTWAAAVTNCQTNTQHFNTWTNCTKHTKLLLI